MNIRSGFILFIIVLFVAFSAAPKPAAADDVQISSGELEYIEDWIELYQGVEIDWQEYETASQWGEIDQADSIIYLYEDVELYFAEGEIYSQELSIYMDEDELIFEEDVLLDYKQEDGNEMEMTSSRMVYYTEEGEFEMTEPLEIEQENREIAAGSGNYDEEDEVFHFADGVEIVENGDTITSNEATLLLEEDEVFTAEGDVEIELDL